VDREVLSSSKEPATAPFPETHENSTQCSTIFFQVSFNIVTYVRFPWLKNVSTAVTIDSTTLLHFLSYATILDGLSAIGG
jgi:hypothetical protein